MENGNITAMMYCAERGFIDLENTNPEQNDSFTKPEVAFGKCITSDNITLQDMKICGKYSLIYNYCDNPIVQERSISSQNLIQNGWFLHEKEKINDSYTYFIFYKVSSD